MRSCVWFRVKLRKMPIQTRNLGFNVFFVPLLSLFVIFSKTNEYLVLAPLKQLQWNEKDVVEIRHNSKRRFERACKRFRSWGVFCDVEGTGIEDLCVLGFRFVAAPSLCLKITGEYNQDYGGAYKWLRSQLGTNRRTLVGLITWVPPSIRKKITSSNNLNKWVGFMVKTYGFRAQVQTCQAIQPLKSTKFGGHIF